MRITSGPSDIPLTTTFTPTSCHSSNNGVLIATDCTTYLGPSVTCYAWYALETGGSGQCYPSGWSPNSYFSPGLCPSGYEMGFSSMVSFGTLTETHGICCPTQVFTFMVETAKPILLNSSWPCVESEPFTYSKTISGTDGVFTSRTTFGYTNAPGVHVRWKAEDFIAPQTTTPGNLNSASSTALSTPSTPTQKPSEMSTSVKAGVGVGVSFGVILAMVCVLGILFLRQKQKNSAKAQSRDDSILNEERKPEGQQISELPTQAGNTAELAGSARDVYELPCPSYDEIPRV